jgi:hypothetical protein
MLFYTLLRKANFADDIHIFLKSLLLLISMVILNEGSVVIKDAGEIVFQCEDLKDTCKITVKKIYMYIFLDYN